MPDTRTVDKLTDKFMPIYLQSLQVDDVLDFDLYLDVGRDIILYRARNLPFTAKALNTLLENKVSSLYVPIDERKQYQKYIEANIDRILQDSSVDQFTKASIVYDSTKYMIQDVLSNPALGENIKRSQALVESTVLFILEGRNAFHNMLEVMSLDYTTYTHSVNVCTFSLALADFCGIQKIEKLHQLGTGALLHDVGKTRISESILNKPGRLSPPEFETVKKHPRWGVDIVKQTDLVPPESYLPIVQHHERGDGSGYPDGIGSDDIHLYGKIVAIADVFDAMTTQRVYRPAVGAFAALKTMFSKKGKFDRQLLEQFTQLMGPTGLAEG